MQVNPATLIDGYKVGHIHQYPKGTEIIFSNLTARSTRRTGTQKVVFAGLQYFLKEYLIKQWTKNFFEKPLEEVVGKFNRRINNYIVPNNVGDQHIRDLHELGYLPIVILALPEGTEYPIGVPCAVIYDTDGRFGWLTNYLETIFSTSVWGICTSATTAHQYKKLLLNAAKETVGDTSFVPWQGHDFSFRGMFGMEAACMSGAGHLFSFTGTDTIPAIDFLEEYYNADCEKEIVGGSVAATEHSVMCAGGADNELGTIRRLIHEVYPTGIVSIVWDTWDYWYGITENLKVLKNEILERDGKVVVRPDTGDPVKVVCGYKVFNSKYRICEQLGEEWDCDYEDAFEGGFEIIKFGDDFYTLEEDFLIGNKHIEDCRVDISEAEVKGSIECLWEIFGGKINEKGYKELDPHIGLIYGDSITLERATQICEQLKDKGFASTNVVFGIGSYTYQYVTRDTDGYAVKATWAKIDGKEMEIFKSPKGASFKKSAKGLTAVFKDENGEFYLKDQATWEEVLNCEFVKVFENGKLLKDYTLQEVRDNLAQYV